MNRKQLYYLLPGAGTLFCLWYIYAASCDGIYTDYVRLVNSYLPDVFSPSKFFVPDLLTRIPVNYLGRVINTALFDYNLMFDRVLGVLSLGLSGAVLTGYFIRKRLSLLWLVVLTAILFGLNKWEMLLNGSGWAHFLAFACFYYHYEVLDRVWSGEERKGDGKILILLPFFTTLLVAGPYCAIYTVTVVFSCVFMGLKSCQEGKNKEGRRFSLLGLCSLLPFFLYLWSNTYAVEDHAAPAKVSLFTQLMDTPGFFVRFFLKGFSSMVIGGEQAEQLFQSNGPYMVLGLLVILIYILAFWFNYYYRLYEKTSLPLALMVSGALNHVLVMLSRWIFLKENYGISSRYALQYQAGILGIILTFALVLSRLKADRRLVSRAAVLAASAFLLAGSCYTTLSEVKKAPYRKLIFQARAELSLDFENRTDDELRENFEYRTTRPDSGTKVRNALTILKENGYSVFQKGKKQ